MPKRTARPAICLSSATPEAKGGGAAQVAPDLADDNPDYRAPP